MIRPPHVLLGHLCLLRTDAFTCCHSVRKDGPALGKEGKGMAQKWVHGPPRQLDGTFISVLVWQQLLSAALVGARVLQVNNMSILGKPSLCLALRKPICSHEMETRCPDLVKMHTYPDQHFFREQIPWCQITACVKQIGVFFMG